MSRRIPLFHCSGNKLKNVLGNCGEVVTEMGLPVCGLSLDVPGSLKGIIFILEVLVVQLIYACTASGMGCAQ